MSRPPRRPGRRHSGRGAGRRRESNGEHRTEIIDIVSLAAQGDGEGRLADANRAFVPLTLPGDRVRVEITGKRGDGFFGRAIEFIEQAPRAQPICEVFGRCGGCQLQHLPAAFYAEWKHQQVPMHLARHGIEAAPEPLIQVPVASRRRVSLAAIRTASGIELGFHTAESDRIVGIGGCPLLVPALGALIGPLKEILADILPAPGVRADIAATALGGTVDLMIEADHEPDLAAREALGEFANARNIARITWRRGKDEPEPIIIRADVNLTIGAATVLTPAGCFLQPSAEGEAALQSLVRAGAGNVSKIADLYCGIGTFALDLASSGAHVFAADADAGQIRALALAAGRAGLGGRIDAECRDLQARPLGSEQLSGFDAVVFDPPRAGAMAQALQIAGSRIRRCVAVSCNPATMARDLKALIDAGFALERLTPLDQFPHTRHVEAVAVLARR